MGSEGALIKRVRGIDLRVVDRLVAVLLAAGALADGSVQLHDRLGVLAIIACVALTGSVALRRRDPVVSTLVAVTGFAAFVAASGYDGDGAFEVAAIALNFYLLGRCTRGRVRALVAAGVFAYWFAGVVVITYSTAGGSVGEVLGGWAVVGGLPFAVGRVLETRRTLTRALEGNRVRLQDEQQLRARRAGAEERARMARELHDVIAHCVSVMVVQTSAAREVATHDAETARTALGVVEGSGRDALVELRRIVGVIHRDSDQPGGSAAPGLSQLEALIDRARAGGLLVELRVEGHAASLSPDVDLVAYRVVQEALTNVLKHAGAARAHVSVSFDAPDLVLQVLDSGPGPTPSLAHEDGSGHGLVGMGERVALYGGQLHVGPRVDGLGFEVRARIPLDGIPSTTPVLSGWSGPDTQVVQHDRLRWPWLDPALALALLVALELATVAGGHGRGPLVLNMIAVAAVALATIWRRRSPLGFLIAVGALTVISSWWLTSLSNAPLTGAYVALVPSYTVAAWEERRKAGLGLALVLVGALIVTHGTPGDLAGAVFALSAAWAAGRAMRARRLLNAELGRTSARLALEREDRARLAVAGERTRIARELHAAVAHSVEAMVIQAQAARALVGDQDARADAMMGAIEQTGRTALGEMRRILGVLRHSQDGGEREPQPGVEQIYTLIQRARERGQPIELSVNGEPGTLPIGVDIGIYRILEEALHSARQQTANAIVVALRFGSDELELQLTSSRDAPNGWPTDAMRERVALCGGELDADGHQHQGWHFIARMPRGQGVLA